MISAVLFDMGGTLHTSHTDEARRLWFARRLMDRLGDYGIGIGLSEEAFSDLLDRNAAEYKAESERTYRELPPDVVWNEWFLKGLDIPAERIRPIAEELSFLYDYERVCNVRRPGLVECMAALRSAGLRLGIISNIISESIVPHFLAEYGISQMMDCVVTSSGTGLRKPSPAIFRVAEEALRLPPESLVYVGDTLSRDVLGVRNAGWCAVIQIDNPASRHRDAGLEHAHIEPDYFIHDLNEIPALIARIEEEERV